MLAISGTRAAEIDLLCGQAEIHRAETHAGIKFFVGRLDGADIVLTCPGPGKIAAAVAAQVIFDRFDADEMICIGSAAPLVPYLQQGDLVLGERLWQFDPAHVSEYTHTHEIETSDAIISADQALLQRIHDTYKALYSHRSNRPQLIAGTIVSDDQGVFDKRTVGLLHREFGVVAADREAAGAAAVCRMNAKPFVVIRTVVDLIDERAAEDNPSGLQAAPDHVTRLIREAFAVRQPVLVR